MIFSRKALGIEISGEGVKMALVGGDRNSVRLDAYNSTPLPPDVLKFGMKEQNVLNPSIFVNIVRDAHLRMLTKTNSVSLSLPESTGRAMLMDLETRFKSKDEGKEIIRWKLKKSFSFNVSETHLDYQVLDEKEDGAISLLVSITSKQVITQYEDLLLEAGLEPKYIEFNTFNIYRLFSGRVSVSENVIFLSFYGGIFTMLVFYGAILSFYRSKDIPNGIFEPNRVYREINNTQLVLQDKYPGFTANEVFCFAGGENAESFRHVVTEAIGIEPIMLDVSRIITTQKDLSLDRKMLHSLTAALGAAVRNL